ncbi:Premnaspirodiene oxygenase [Triticum urartu]|uniref:Premnaspirodiene oxygenase n=1 Tax=Triticum urartu TaxID=4572 RepID=M8AKM6_TRIUA|nr:Premnaspirodiene oxygenase [Triticum urartu]
MWNGLRTKKAGGKRKTKGWLLESWRTNQLSRSKIRGSMRMRVDEIRQAGPSKPVNLSVMFHGLTNSIIARAAFGRTPKKSPEFLAAVTSGKLQGQIREASKGKSVVTEADLQESNLRYLKLVIKEALRLHPPGALLDAEEFQPERFEDGAVDFTGNNFEFVPFGAGRRMCPGINYALAVMELALVGLLYHFDWSLPEGVSEVDMEEARGLGVRRRTPLMLIATPFVPAALA